MVQIPAKLVQRTVGEWVLGSTRDYGNPFADVRFWGSFVSPSGAQFRVPGFYDGDQIWRLRFNPPEPGLWRYRTSAHPDDPELALDGTITVDPGQGRAALRATPGQAWGFAYASGEPFLALGDTTYNLFGMAHCGYDVSGFLQRRARQGFNLLRVRLPVSPFHPPQAYSQWQTRRTWPWGGSEQAPRFDCFNLDYFRTVDRVVSEVEALGLGLEMIMEAWGIIHGFENSWGPWCVLDQDQPGLHELLLVRRFLQEVVPFHLLRPVPELVGMANEAPGETPLALASADRAVITVYLPVGGAVQVKVPDADALGRGYGYAAQWYDPTTGALTAAQGQDLRFEAPGGLSRGHPKDWVLVLDGRGPAHPRQ